MMVVILEDDMDGNLTVQFLHEKLSIRYDNIKGG